MAATSISSGNKSQLCCLFLIFFIITHKFKPIRSEPTQAEDVYIIHMDPSAMPKAFTAKTNWYMSSLESISSPNSKPVNPKTQKSVDSSKLIYTYNHVVDGFSASLTLSELNSIQRLPGFVSAKRDMPVKLDTTHSNEFIGLTPDIGAWPAADFGRGVIIGVVDTGVWPESKSFSDDGMDVIPSKWKGECEAGQEFNSSLCNKKLIGVRYFNKGLAANNPNVTISMNSTRDRVGHGTHTASTAAGNYVTEASFFGYAAGTARGTAPRAHLAVYKVGWKEGMYGSDIIAAVDRAVHDGVDVISLSIGTSSVALYNDPVAIATFRAVAKGIFVTTSAGNEGPQDRSVHNGTPWVTTVAAGTVDRGYYGMLTLGNGISINGLALYTGSYPTEPVPMIFINQCVDLDENNVEKKAIVVCEQRNGSLNRETNNVLSSNLIGVVSITDLTVDLNYQLKTSFPAMFVNRKDGEKIKEYIKQSKTVEPTAKLELRKTSIGKNPAPMAAIYSSRGPSPACPFVMKPDIMAPGDLILASWPDNVSVMDGFGLFSKFNLISGTSMSTPHIAGVAALIRAVHPEWSPSVVRSAIMTTSDIIDNTGQSIQEVGFNYRISQTTPLAMGSGHVNPNKTLNPGLVYNTTTQDYINLMCGMNFTQQQINVITGESSSNCSAGSLDLNYPSFIAFFDSNLPESRMVKEFKRTVTNVDDGQASYTVEVTPINGFNINVVPEKSDFQSKFETRSFTVRIEGVRRDMKGDRDFGYLIWKDLSEKHIVRSPVVVTSLSSNVLRY